MSTLPATGIAQLAIPLLNAQFGFSIPGVLSSPRLWLFIAILVLVVSIASGAFPAFLLSSFKPVNVLKGEIRG